MVTARDISNIQMLQPDEQVVVLSLVKSFINLNGKMNESQNRLKEMRDKYSQRNPMSMEEIDKIIHEG